MRVLITNSLLDRGGGTQTDVRDLAVWLLARGHSPFVYSPVLGDGAAQLRRHTIPVTEDLSTVGAAPDIIHGNSSVETVIALLRFPTTPAIFVCHSWNGLMAAPPKFARVRRYVAVDETCADRLLVEEGLSADKVSVLLNAVDVSRFPLRGPLPPRPKRALVFGNPAHELTYLSLVREACRKAEVDLDVAGALAGNYTTEPETLLGQYDLVFAKAKCAMEAMVAGAAVILCDGPGIGGMVRSYEVDRLRRFNFGVRTMTTPLSVEAFSREIEAYDAADARKVSDMMRRAAPADARHEALVALYEEVIAEHQQAGDSNWADDSRAAAAFIERMARGSRLGHDRIHVALRATQRIFSIPLLGPGMTKAAKWLLGKGERGR